MSPLTTEQKRELARARREADRADRKGIGRTVHHDLVDRLERADGENALSDMNRRELEEMADDYGVMPEQGSGVDGAVLKEDIVEALEEIDG